MTTYFWSNLFLSRWRPDGSWVFVNWPLCGKKEDAQPNKKQRKPPGSNSRAVSLRGNSISVPCRKSKRHVDHQVMQRPRESQEVWLLQQIHIRFQGEGNSHLLEAKIDRTHPTLPPTKTSGSVLTWVLVPWRWGRGNTVPSQPRTGSSLAASAELKVSCLSNGHPRVTTPNYLYT